MGCGVLFTTSHEYRPHWVLLGKMIRSPRRSELIAARIRWMTLALAFTSSGDLGLVLNRNREANSRQLLFAQEAALNQERLLSHGLRVTQAAQRCRAELNATLRAVELGLSVARSCLSTRWQPNR